MSQYVSLHESLYVHMFVHFYICFASHLLHLCVNLFVMYVSYVYLACAGMWNLYMYYVCNTKHISYMSKLKITVYMGVQAFCLLVCVAISFMLRASLFYIYFTSPVQIFPNFHSMCFVYIVMGPYAQI